VRDPVAPRESKEARLDDGVRQPATMPLDRDRARSGETKAWRARTRSGLRARSREDSTRLPHTSTTAIGPRGVARCSARGLFELRLRARRLRDRGLWIEDRHADGRVVVLEEGGDEGLGGQPLWNFRTKQDLDGHDCP